MNLKTIAQGFAAAILLLLLRVWPQISPHHAMLYHSFLPMQSMIWGVFIDLIVVALLAALLFSYLERSEAGRRNAVWALVAAVLVPALAADAAAVWQINLPHIYGELLFYRHSPACVGIALASPGLLSAGSSRFAVSLVVRGLQPGVDGSGALISGLARPTRRH